MTKPSLTSIIEPEEDDLDRLNALSERRPEPVEHRQAILKDQPQCAAVKRNGEQCVQRAQPGSTFCRFHGGGNVASLRYVKERLLLAAPTAVQVLCEAMEQADWLVAVSAAKALLDRAGIGTNMNININDQRTDDLDKLTDEQLENRAMTLANMIRQRRMEKIEPAKALDTGDAIDAEVVGVREVSSGKTGENTH